ncbi:MAG: choline-sulfatase [Urechidicola sp.]
MTKVKQQKQNILIVMADQLTALALGCYGNPTVKSPNIDRLAAQGVIFESAYSSSPLCTPARYAFMTGQNISQCGGYDNAAYMPSTMPTFAHYLRLMGYKTCLSGKMHFVGPDQLHGFEQRVTTDIYPADFGWIPDWTNPDKRIDLWYHNMSSVQQAGVSAITNQFAYDDEVGTQSQRVIYDHARTEDDRPLCLVTSFIHPHDPYATRQKYWDLYDDVNIPMPTVPRPSADQQDAHNKRLEKVIDLDAIDVSDDEIINARRAYYGNVSYVDEWVGRLQDTLEECGMTENTTIIFTSDHGDMLGEFGLWYKMSFRESSCRIPMIIHNPKRFDAGRVSQPVAQVDILPTLIDLAAEGTGATKPSAIDPLNGRSLIPLCDGDAVNDPNSCVSEYLAEGTGAPMLMIRRAQYKFISCMDDPDQLFDLELDPNELNNLSVGEPIQLLEDFRSEVQSYWNAESLQQKVIHNQARRRSVHAALRVGSYQDWDYNPQSDASQQYTRSHMDLTTFDITSRFPRPKPFTPR